MIRDVLIIVNRAKIHTEVCKNSNNRELNDTLFVQENVKVTKKISLAEGMDTLPRQGACKTPRAAMGISACGVGKLRRRRLEASPAMLYVAVCQEGVSCRFRRGT